LTDTVKTLYSNLLAGRRAQNQLIRETYRLAEVATHLGVFSATVSRRLKTVEQQNI